MNNHQQQPTNSQFVCIHLGVEGGLNEANLSAHLLAPQGSQNFICLDAGTILAGLKVARQAGSFADFPLSKNSDLDVEGQILHHHIKGYCISHTYLDHVSGLTIVSPEDKQKPIFGLANTIADLKEYLFNWRTWPNFGDCGVEPCLGVYNYVTLTVGKSYPIPDTQMKVIAFPLAHGNHGGSAAFLIEANGFYVLYLGDTGPDELSDRHSNEEVWRYIVPLIQQKRLCGIFMEASYPDNRPDSELFSHLTPAWMMSSLRRLAALVDPENPQQALAGLTLIVTHIKPWLKAGLSTREIVEAELTSHNDLGLNLVFATQGQKTEL